MNKDVVSTELKRLGQSGARLLEDMFGYRVKRVLEESGREELTVDADSTVKMVYGKQEGAAKGFNPKKRGGWSYHPIIIFATELKLLINTWFRSGQTYTSNGIVEFLKQTINYIPDGVKIFFERTAAFLTASFLTTLNRLAGIIW